MSYQAFDLSGKSILITGGNGGIGFGMAEALVRAGASVAIWGTNEAKNADALAALQKIASGKVAAWQVDVSDEAQVEKGIFEVIEQFGRIDSAFANAGMGRMSKSFSQMSTEDYRAVLAVNLDGVFFTLRAVGRHMEARAKEGDGGGMLVVTASLAAIEGAARNQHYAATKGAVVSMMRSIAVEYARYGVRANSILPGWIATDMTQPMQDNPRFAETVLPRVPVRRWGVPADFGGIAVYLASDASLYHTGDSIVIDGGFSKF